MTGCARLCRVTGNIVWQATLRSYVMGFSIKNLPSPCIKNFFYNLLTTLIKTNSLLLSQATAVAYQWRDKQWHLSVLCCCYFRLLIRDFIDKSGLLEGNLVHMTFTYSLQLLMDQRYGLLGKVLLWSVAQGGPCLPVMSPSLFDLMTRLNLPRFWTKSTM